jgi:Arc/MetJ family transcription regulator
MKTTIAIDDQLINQALEATGLATQEEVVVLGLQMLIQFKLQSQIKQFKGKLRWEGDLDKMRQD